MERLFLTKYTCIKQYTCIKHFYAQPTQPIIETWLITRVIVALNLNMGNRT